MELESGPVLGITETLRSASEVLPRFQEIVRELKYERRGVCNTEMFFVYATAAPLKPKQILESGRARGQSTFVLGRCFSETRVISVELDSNSPDSPFAEARLKELPNVTCLYGDSRKLLPEHLNDQDVVVIDGPKGFRALRLAFNLLRTGRPQAVFLHDFAQGKAERRFLERNLPDAFFSDHPDFTGPYAFLEGQIDPATLRWAVFACIPEGPSRPFGLLLWKLSLARAMTLAPEKIDKLLKRLSRIFGRLGHPGRA
jgi:hypothetical protein